MDQMIRNVSLTLLMTVLFASLNAKVFYEQRLLKTLLSDYDPRARPVAYLDAVINVNISFHLTKVVSLDTKEQILQTSGWLQLTWVDERLTWDPNAHGMVQLVAFLPTDVWIPNFALENSAASFHDFNHHRLFRVSARYDGLLIWEPAGAFQTFCPLDVTFYPFDTQTCALRFVDWVYSDGKVQLDLATDYIERDETYYQRTGEWRIQKTSAFAETIQYDGNETFTRVSFIVVIHRQFIHYFVNLLFPAFILSFLVLLVYFVPRTLGDRKLGMGITLMMSYFVFNLSVAEDVPKSSEHIALIQIYLLFYMNTTAVTITLAVMFVWLEHTRHVAPPPKWLRFIVYQVFARVVCYGKMCGSVRFKNRTKEDEEILERQMKHEQSSCHAAGGGEGRGGPHTSGIAASTLVEIAQFASVTAALEKDLNKSTPGSSPVLPRKRKDSTDSLDGKRHSFAKDIRPKLEAIEYKSKEVMKHLFEAVKKEAKFRNIDRIREEWTEITKIINAFSFYVLLTVTIVFILMCVIMWIIVDLQ